MEPSGTPEQAQNPAAAGLLACCDGVFLGGSYRDRTDDIHGVNVALYQLS